MNNVYSPHRSYKQPPRGAGYTKRVHPAKEIDLTAVKMIRHIRRSVAVFFSPSDCKLKTCPFLSVFICKSNDMVNSSRCTVTLYHSHWCHV